MIHRERPSFRLHLAALLALAGALLCLASAPPVLCADAPPELKALVEKFFACYAREDLEGFMALWSAGSPDAAARRRTMQETFAEDDRIEVRSLRILQAEVAGERATVRVAVEMSGVVAKTGQPSTRFGKLDRTLECVREVGGWRVWRYFPSVDDLVQRLAGAATDAERQALVAAEPGRVTPEVVLGLRVQGDAAYYRADYSKALALYRFAHRIATQIQDRSGAAWALSDAAWVLADQGDYARALADLKTSLQTFEELHQPRDVAETLNRTGKVYYDWGSYAQALSYFERSRQGFEALHEATGLAGVFNNTGNVYQAQGDFGAALAQFRKGLAEFERTGNTLGASQCVNSMGTTYHAQGDLARALDCYRKSLRLKEQCGDRAGMIVVHNNLANLAYLRGDAPEALENYRKSLELCQQAGDRAHMASTRGNMSALYEWLRDEKSARECLEQSLAGWKELDNPAGIAFWTCRLATFLGQHGAPERALDLFLFDLPLADKVGDRETVARCHWGLGRSYRAQGDSARARAAYMRAIDTLEKIRSRIAGGEEERLTYLGAGGWYRIYEELVDLLLKEGKVPEALAALERARSKQLLDGIRLDSLTSSDPNLRLLLARAADLEGRLAAQQRARLAEFSRPTRDQDPVRVQNLDREIAADEKELYRVYNDIVDANPDYRGFLPVRDEEIDEVRWALRQLPPGAVALAYSPQETALAILVLTRDSVRAHAVPVSRARLEELVDVVRRETGQAPASRGARPSGAPAPRRWTWDSAPARPLRDALTTLYGYLIAPVQDEVARARTLVLMPSGPLCYLPFQALAREERSSGVVEYWRHEVPNYPILHHSTTPSPRSPPRLRFLIEDRPLAVLPSIALWNRIGQRSSERSSRREGRLAAFGNPDGTLPAAEVEARRVGALFPRSLVYLREQATLERVENLPREVSIVHLATHGHLDARRTNDSFLILAGGERLRLGNLCGLKGRYPARMTVLSGCDTARDRNAPGNELHGLAKAFGIAGSTTLVASLWPVDDAATARLMERFYRALKDGRSGAEALREAEIALLQDPASAHPHFWAPFLLIGDWR